MLLRAAGHLMMFIPPMLLMASIATDRAALALVCLIFIVPLLRSFFGDVRRPAAEWSERVATALEWMPVVCAVTYLGAIAFTLFIVRNVSPGYGTLVWIGGSLWSAMIFASCVAHELVHRTDALSRHTGRMLSGVIGYPVLEHEHFAHHVQSTDQLSQSPAVGESVYIFSARRLLRAVPAAIERDIEMGIRRGHSLRGGLSLSFASTVATAGAFTWAAGAAGLLLYSALVLAISWSLQAITYIQHWGLGEGDSLGSNWAWEDRCRLQSWLTLGISFHQAHHQSAHVPYYRQEPRPDSPKAPAGYVVLFFASLVPAVWRWLMIPALKRWQSAPQSQRTAGRSLICFR